MTKHGPATLIAGGLAVLVLASGCSGDSEEPKGAPSTELTEITVECARYADTAQRITDAQTALYDGKHAPEDDAAVDALVKELDALQEGAPSDVRTALTDLGEGFRSAQQLLADPTEANRAALAELTPKLSEDSQTVTGWIVEQCGR
ncbi:hypothetical protein ACFFOS_00215 [Nocardioides kongjuensis]|uniref:Lipoprotein n=1 Tax=Nocardioides kongjuensis TaxID=349522 RepID=A0A852RKX1_9ACTN|nr:hypothetical protein [Nocardioides kongjuensis]NYD29966.1 hypothetical protein [Nocardioides kongjuensis]